jgi:hypothetical protein
MNKPFLQFALLCDEVIKDELTKKLSFIGLFDKINSNKLPITQSKIYIVSRWLNISDGLEHIQNFKIIREQDGEEIYDSKKNENPFLLKNKKDNHTVIAVINNIRFDQAGNYYILFFLDGEVQPQKIYFEISLL